MTGVSSKARSLLSQEGNKAKIRPAPPGQGHASFLLLPAPSICFLRAARGKNCTRAANFFPPAQEQPLASAPRHLLVCYYRHKPFPSPAGARNVLRNPSSKGPCSCLGNRHRHPGRWSHGTSTPAAWFPLVGELYVLPDARVTEPTAKNLNGALGEGETEFEQNSCPGAGNAELPKDY